jgi:peptide/nickel transport system permease protein
MTTQVQRQTNPQTTEPTTTKQRRWLRRLRKSPLAITGVVIIAVFLLVVIFAPFLAPYGPTTQNLRTTYIPPGTGVHWGGPNGEFGLFVSPVTRSPIGGISVDDSER